MLCIVFMEVSGGRLTKYISGKLKLKIKKNFSIGCLMDNLIYFLNSNAGCSTTSFKKNNIQGTMHLKQWQHHGTVTDECSNKLVQFLQNPSEGM